jgi:hypothetical protein
MYKDTCDRCGKPLNGCHIMSWFTEEEICTTGEDNCHDKERELRRKLRERDSKEGKEITARCPYEGCGYIPKL